MRFPPLKAIEAVKINRVDGRTRRLVTHFRHFFICKDRDGKPTDDENAVARIELTKRAEDYFAAQSQGKARIPA